MEKTAIHCPTQELWNKVLDKMFEEGIKSGSSKEWWIDIWKDCKENSCLTIYKNKNLLYCEKSWYEKYGYQIIPAEEYLGIQTKNKNIMSKILDTFKEAFLTEDERLFRKHGLKDENGNYTQEYRELVLLDLFKKSEGIALEVAKKLEAENKK